MLVSMVSALLYVLASCIAATLIVPVQRNASRAARVARVACGVCAAAALAAALAATLSGLFVLGGGFFEIAAAI